MQEKSVRGTLWHQRSTIRDQIADEVKNPTPLNNKHKAVCKTKYKWKISRPMCRKHHLESLFLIGVHLQIYVTSACGRTREPNLTGGG